MVKGDGVELDRGAVSYICHYVQAYDDCFFGVAVVLNILSKVVQVS